MPIHDWTRVRSGTFHNFHYGWLAAIRDRLNAGLLPPGFFAMAEQFLGKPQGDVVTLENGANGAPRSDLNRNTAVTTARPKTKFVLAAESERYARKANRIAIHHELGNVVAVLEIVSPGNKGSQHALRTFVEKAADLIDQGVHRLMIDLFPPGPRDPQGIHKLIWDEITDQPFELPPDKPLTLAAYQAIADKMAYVEPVAVGDTLPDMPLYLQDEYHVNVPLEETYQATWNVLPKELRALLDLDAK